MIFVLTMKKERFDDTGSEAMTEKNSLILCRKVEGLFPMKSVYLKIISRVVLPYPKEAPVIVALFSARVYLICDAVLGIARRKFSD